MGSPPETKVPDNCADAQFRVEKQHPVYIPADDGHQPNIPEERKTLFFLKKKDPSPPQRTGVRTVEHVHLGNIRTLSNHVARIFTFLQPLLMMFNLALSSSAGSPFCTDMQNYRHFVETRRTTAILYRHVELPPFCTDTHRTVAILYRHVELPPFCADT